MNIVELYEQTPVDLHSQIVISGDRLFFEEEEYVIGADEELELIRSHKQSNQRLDQIAAKLSII